MEIKEAVKILDAFQSKMKDGTWLFIVDENEIYKVKLAMDIISKAVDEGVIETVDPRSLHIGRK